MVGTNKEKYLKWYKLARDTIKYDYLFPERNEKDILNLVSQEDWLLFGLADVDDKKEAKNLPRPNIFFTITKNDNKDYGRLGITFNNVGAVDVLKNILSRYCKEEKETITKLLLSLDGSWEITVSRKIKDYNYVQTPKFMEVFKVSCNEINERIVDQIISWVNRIREEGIEKRKSSSSYYLETPSVDLIESTFELSDEEFKRRIKEASDILKVCLDVKSDREIKNIVDSRKEELVKLEERESILERKLANKEQYLRLGVATPEQIFKTEEELQELKKQKAKLVEELK